MDGCCTESFNFQVDGRTVVQETYYYLSEDWNQQPWRSQTTLLFLSISIPLILDHPSISQRQNTQEKQSAGPRLRKGEGVEKLKKRKECESKHKEARIICSCCGRKVRPEGEWGREEGGCDDGYIGGERHKREEQERAQLQRWDWLCFLRLNILWLLLSISRWCYLHSLQLRKTVGSRGTRQHFGH